MLNSKIYIIFVGLLMLVMSSCFRFSSEHKETLYPQILDSAQVFEDYDFNSGEFELFGVYWSDFNRSSLADSIGQFSIRDTALLNRIQASWDFKLSDPYECGYDYNLYLTKGDSIVETFNLNIGCKSLTSKRRSYRIEREYIEDLYGKTDSIEYVRVVFYGQDQAVEYLEGMRADSNVFVLDDGGYVWEKYIGYFEVTYINEDIRDSKIALQEIQKEISKKYKTNDFEVDNVGSDYNTGAYKIRIYAHKDFADNFDLYPIRKEYTYIINYSMTGFLRL